MLSETQIQRAKPRAKEYALSDGNGLYLFVTPIGSKIWRFRYRYNGATKRITLGKWPYTSTDDARAETVKYQAQLKGGIDPLLLNSVAVDFESIVREWIATQLAPRVTLKRVKVVTARFENYIFPYIGSRDIKTLTAPEILSAIRKAEGSGIVYTAHMLRAHCSRVFSFAIASGRAENNPADALMGALMPRPRVKHRATITKPEEIAKLLRAMRNYGGGVVVKTALWLTAYTFTRQGELRHAEWSEISGDTWSIPAEKMKMRRPHVVPLARQVLELLENLRKYTGKGRYLFPNVTGRGVISDATVGKALRLIGYSRDRITPHGFRGMASTILNESGLFRPDVIERQLAHVDGNKIRAAYNHADYLPQRRKMMEFWAEYLVALRDGAPLPNPSDYGAIQ